jgi:hypothetical protein
MLKKVYGFLAGVALLFLVWYVNKSLKEDK